MYTQLCHIRLMAGWHHGLDRRWVWVNSKRWTGRPGGLWFMGSQRVGHDWTELNWSLACQEDCLKKEDKSHLKAGWRIERLLKLRRKLEPVYSASGGLGEFVSCRTRWGVCCLRCLWWWYDRMMRGKMSIWLKLQPLDLTFHETH